MTAEPAADNDWLAAHAQCILRSYRHWTGRDLIAPAVTAVEAARALYHAPIVVLSHDTSADPSFTYANLAAQRLFGRDWEQFVGLPSRLSAEPLVQAERARLLAEVARQGYAEGYSGVRITADGRRFRVLGATVWNLRDERGSVCGQAACFSAWEWL
ncbi:MAG: MEKHLA domain-containing protein [Thiobacillaceae bacterium]|nr:MEKHLA domain-containing protein [Thiobacillaceae bacterium]